MKRTYQSFDKTKQNKPITIITIITIITYNKFPKKLFMSTCSDDNVGGMSMFKRG